MSDAPSIWDSLTPVERARVREMAFRLVVRDAAGPRGRAEVFSHPSLARAVDLVAEWLIAPKTRCFPHFILDTIDLSGQGEDGQQPIAALVAAMGNGSKPLPSPKFYGFGEEDLLS